MLLRKHLTGARIADIGRLPGERILLFKLKASDAMGVKSEKLLILEMFGRQSNIILTDNQSLIIDCLRRISSEFNDKRAVLPGLIYHEPPKQEGKFDPLDLTEDKFTQMLEENNNKDEAVEKWLLKSFSSFSPLICRELAWRSYGSADCRFNEIKDNGNALKNNILALIKEINENAYEPWLIYSEEGKPWDFSYTEIKQYENKCSAIREESFSALLDKFYTRKSQDNRIAQRCAATMKTVKNIKERLIRKLAIQKAELLNTAKRDEMRKKGDLIRANIHLMKKGQSILEAKDYYSENEEIIKIELDPMKTPQQNSEKYYKAYTKAKNAQKFITLQIESGEKELDYIESVIRQLSQAENENELNEIRNELIQTKYLKEQKKQRNNKSKQPESLPHQFMSSNGMRIYAGKNNLQNDMLTLKTAAKSDIWFHAQKIHGAHVIVSCDGITPDEKTINEAAAIAAYYSSARSSGKVPVDYTQVRNVKKPSGSRPGMVIYTDYKTIYAPSCEEQVIQLRV